MWRIHKKKRGRLSNDKSDNAMKDLKDDAAPTDEIVYKDSSTFLKGTQSSNPHNDYCQHFIDTGQRPQNFIRDVGLADRFEEYPKLRELIKLKDDLIAETATPPMYLKTDLLSYNLKELNCKFDVILIEPPLEEYQRTCGATNVQLWNWDQIMELDIGEVAANRSFVFLWCGSSDGLDMGRFCLRKWGFRRCEDICWIRTNINNPGHSKNLDSKAVLQRTKEHCLMGIKGTVRRSTDGDFIHANVDIDLIISEEPDYGSIEKPVEIFHIIEHFCLGRRRLHLFGRDSTIRPGWLTVGPELTNTNFNADLYQSYFTNGQITTGCTERIEALRPKSPPPKGKVSGRGRGGFNRGRASACVYQEEFCGGRGIGEQGVYACVAVAGTGWRWWLFHLFAHDNRLSNQAVRGFSGQRLIVTVKKCLASRSAPPSSSQSSLNSHKYVDSPASRPIVSRGKRARKSGRDNTNFLGQSTVTEVWA